MSKDTEKSTKSNHVDEFRHLDKEFDSILNVIRRSNIDPHLFCLKRIIGEIDDAALQFNSTREFQKRIVEMCGKEINEGSVNFDFDLLSKCCIEIINDNYGSINFDKAAHLLESSVQVYSGKVDHLHSLVSEALESIKKKDQPEEQKYVAEQTEEKEADPWVPDDMEVDREGTLDDTASSSIKLVKPPEDLVLEGDGLDAAGDGEGLQSYTIAKSVPSGELLQPNLSENEAFDELMNPLPTWSASAGIKALNDFLYGIVNVTGGNSKPSESLDDVQPADGGNPVPQNMLEDDNAYFHGDSYGYKSQVPDAKIEECLQPQLDSPLAKTGEDEKPTELPAHLSLWKQKIEQALKEQKARPVFDINDYGGRVLDKLSQSADLKNTAPFADVVQGEEKHDVARSFSALLHLANNGTIDLQKSDTTDGESMSAEPLSVRLLRHAKRRQEVQFQSSKKRALSQTTEGDSKDKKGSSGKENCEP